MRHTTWEIITLCLKDKKLVEISLCHPPDNSKDGTRGGGGFLERAFHKLVTLTQKVLPFVLHSLHH